MQGRLEDDDVELEWIDDDDVTLEMYAWGEDDLEIQVEGVAPGE